MLEMPIIKIELLNMKQSMQTALTSYHLQIEDYVSGVLTGVVENFDYESVIRKEAEEVLSNAISMAIRDYFLYGDGQKEIKNFMKELFTHNEEL